MDEWWSYVDLQDNLDLLSEPQKALLAAACPDGRFMGPVTRDWVREQDLMWTLPYCYMHRLFDTDTGQLDALILFAGTEVTKYMGDSTGRSFREIEETTGRPTAYLVDLIAQCHDRNSPLLGTGVMRHFGRDRIKAVSLVISMQGDTDSEQRVLICNDYRSIDRF